MLADWSVCLPACPGLCSFAIASGPSCMFCRRICACMCLPPSLLICLYICPCVCSWAVLPSHDCLTVLLAHLQDAIDASPAVLVKRYDITEQKELELNLSVQQQELQRYEPALLSHFSPICLALHFYNCSPAPPSSAPPPLLSPPGCCAFL